MTETNEQFHVPSVETDDTIDVLRSALTSKDVLHEPWTSGVIPLTPSESTLFFKRQDGTPNVIDLCSITSTQTEDLSGACQPATFGLDQKNVLDLTYRKAGKLDAGNFLWGFNPDNGDFTEKIASGLFPWQSLHKGIRFELYKFNVYGEGSFFKAHQDTPRSQDMFGSLVVVLPFLHQGGNLLLRHRGREYTFNGSASLQETSAPSAAYIAFFSDVEHEVALVESGNRVTVTYNLYFDPAKGAPIPQVPISSQLEHPFKTALRTCLEDANTRRAHPFLGFGLDHAYPFENAILRPRGLKLKGSDATLIHILTELNVKHFFYLLYRQDPKRNDCPFRVLSRVVVDGNDDYTEYEDKGPFNMIAKDKYSFLVWDKDPQEVQKNPPRWNDWYSTYREKPKRYQHMPVRWITEPKEEYVDRSISVAYGNEPGLGFFYHQLCVVAVIASSEDMDDSKGEASVSDDTMDEDSDWDGDE